MSMYTVPTTGTYRHTETGVGYRYHAGDVIPLELAVMLGMPAAQAADESSPFAGPEERWLERAYGPNRTIHNYFPDGAISSAALIDTDNSYPDSALWTNNGYGENLEFVDRSASSIPNAVKVTFPGGAWGEGFWTMDNADTYGLGSMPAGRYRIGATFAAFAPPSRTPIRVTAATPTDDPNPSAREVVYLPINTPERIILDVYTHTAGRLALYVYTNPLDYPEGADFPSLTLLVSELMITDGDPFDFRDGDAEGWSWSGAPHASASFGPQP